SICLHGRAELGLAPDEYAALTMVLLRLLAFKPVAAAGGAEKKTLTTADTAPLPVPPVVRQAVAPAPPPMAAAAAPAIALAPPPAPKVMPPALLETAQRPPVPTVFPAAKPDPVPAPPAAPLPWEDAPPEPVLAPVPAPAAVADTPLGERWHTLVQSLVASEAITALARELALQSQLQSCDDGLWCLRIESESLNQPTARERLTTALQAAGHAQSGLRIELGPVSDTPARRNAAAEKARQEQARATVLADSRVQAWMRDYDARIVPGSIQPR
ncbi:MAG: DNA polymerase III subunit gamma/tau, partial [Burkholderiaceae bacterium]|nr:DNA polymerase III subunit gamma/tau [Burkholderiaceae bacterium]